MNWIKLVLAYGKYKDLEKRTQSDNFLKDKAFEIANNPKYGEYQRGLASMVYKFFDKKSKGTGIKNEIKENQQLANELHKPVIMKFRKRKVYSSFKGNICSVDLADMQLISKYIKGIRYLLCAIELFSKYAYIWVIWVFIRVSYYLSFIRPDKSDLLFSVRSLISLSLCALSSVPFKLLLGMLTFVSIKSLLFTIFSS